MASAAGRSKAPHPDYDAAPPDLQWKGGDLRKLYRTLQDEALDDVGRWKSRILFGGALVSFRFVDTGDEALPVVRISRSKPPAGPDGAAAWKRELRVFEREFGLDRDLWKRRDDRSASGIAEIFEPR